MTSAAAATLNSPPDEWSGVKCEVGMTEIVINAVEYPTTRMDSLQMEASGLRACDSDREYRTGSPFSETQQQSYTGSISLPVTMTTVGLVVHLQGSPDQ